MPLQTSGQISLSQIQTEYGGANNLSISEYYNNAPDATPNVSTSRISKIRMIGVSGTTDENADIREFEFDGLGDWGTGDRRTGNNEITISTNMNTISDPNSNTEPSLNAWINGSKELDTRFLVGQVTINSNYYIEFEFVGSATKPLVNDFNKLKIYWDKSDISLDADMGTWEIMVYNEDGKELTYGNITLTESNIVNTSGSSTDTSTITNYGNVSDSLIAHYKLDSDFTDSTQTYADLIQTSTNFNNGVMNDSVEFNDGDGNNDGVGDWLQFPSNFNPYTIWNGNGITISFWLKLTETTISFNRIFDFGKAGGQPTGYSTGLFLASHKDNWNGYYKTLVFGTDSPWGLYQSDTSKLDEIWTGQNFHHIVWCIATNGLWTIYIDGVDKTSYVSGRPTTANSWGVQNISYDSCYINRSTFYPSDDHFKGFVDDFRIYNRPLTATEVQTLYNSAFITKTQIDEEYKYIKFKNNGNNQTSYTITFPENTTGDILIVGGGGAGGTQYIGAGGGAGGLVYDTNISLSGTYDILVGRGGVAVSTGGEEDGFSSKISQSASTLYQGYGGGNGGTYNSPDGATGGSSGGTTSTVGRTQDNNQALINHPPANATKGIPIDKSFGNQGSVYWVTQGKFYAGGGGGAGSNAYRETGKYGWGGDGKLINITGQNVYYAGGGGGGSDWAGYAAAGGSGIGGNGASGNEDPNISPTSGSHNTGSGGGGGGGGAGGAVNDGGGSGGSGIVIIKYRLNVSTDPVTTPIASINTLDSNYKYVVFQNTGDNQTSYNITFNESTLCDILIVGGGGSGGVRDAGAGGAGGLIYLTNVNILNSNLSVGKGGASISSSLHISGYKGNNSFIVINSITYTAEGGGKGGQWDGSNNNSTGSGGSGGGGGGNNSAGGTGNQPSSTSGGYGNNGAQGGGSYSGGGGGGAGGAGTRHSGDTGGNGGIGMDFSAIFGTEYGENGWFAGGGGMGSGSGANGTGGLGGGGNGANSGAAEGGMDGTGGGGGGHRNSGGTSGKGGDGIIIIRYPNNTTSHHLEFNLGTPSAIASGGYVSTVSYIPTSGTIKLSDFYYQAPVSSGPPNPPNQTGNKGVSGGLGNTGYEIITGMYANNTSRTEGTTSFDNRGAGGRGSSNNVAYMNLIIQAKPGDVLNLIGRINTSGNYNEYCEFWVWLGSWSRFASSNATFTGNRDFNVNYTIPSNTAAGNYALAVASSYYSLGSTTYRSWKSYSLEVWT